MDVAQPHPIHMGRRVFLGALLAGVAGLALNIRKLPGLSFVASAFTVDGFEIYETSGIPNLTEADYRLSVGGLVRTPQTLTLADVLAMPRTRVVRDYHCVTGWSVPRVAWTGVQLTDFLAAVKPGPPADCVLLASSIDSYSASVDICRPYLPPGRLCRELS